jgi:hypothetical protein
MALKFDLYLGDWPARYGGVRKVIKGAIPRVLNAAPDGSFKATAKNKVYIVIKRDTFKYDLYVKDLKKVGNEYVSIGDFRTEKKAKEAIELLAK